MMIADAATVWSPGDLYVAIQPFVKEVLMVLVSAGLAWIGKLLNDHFGITVDENARKAIQDAAANAAGRIMASQDARFAAMQVDVKSDLIAAEIPLITAAVGDSMKKLGVTPDSVAALVAGKLGQLQAQAQSVQIPAVDPVQK